MSISIHICCQQNEPGWYINARIFPINFVHYSLRQKIAFFVLTFLALVERCIKYHTLVLIYKNIYNYFCYYYCYYDLTEVLSDEKRIYGTVLAALQRTGNCLS